MVETENFEELCLETVEIGKWAPSQKLTADKLFWAKKACLIYKTFLKYKAIDLDEVNMSSLSAWMPLLWM